MPFPGRPRHDDFDEVARAALASLAGAICGVMTMLGAVHLPVIVFQLHGDGAAGFVLAFGFWGLPIGFIAGAIAGPYARRRFGGLAVVLAMVASLIGGTTIAAVAEGSAVGLPKLSADGCENFARRYTMAPNAEVVIFRRSCPGRAATIEATVALSGQHVDETAPGNALALATRGVTLDSLGVRVMGGPDSIMAFAYDPRYSVLRLTPRIGDIAIQAIPDVRHTPVATAAADSNTSLATSDHHAVVEPPPAPCSIEPRMIDGSPGPRVSIFKRTCPGKPPTIEAFIPADGGSTYAADHGNALVVDASADSAEHPLTIFVRRPSRSAIVFEVDRRAHIIYLAPRVHGVSVEATSGTTRPAPRFTASPRPPAAG